MTSYIKGRGASTSPYHRRNLSGANGDNFDQKLMGVLPYQPNYNIIS